MNRNAAAVSPAVSPKDRLRTLEMNRHRKMARSAHAYVRGNTLKFYEWLERGAGDSVPSGPSIWICGDCHVGNLGPVASVDGEVEIEIRDLDQTVVGNPAHDLIRLGLSLSTAARGSDLPGVTTAHMLEHMLIGYERALAPARRSKKLAASEVRPVNEILQQAVKRRWKHLAEERIEDVKPKIPLGRRFWELLPAEHKAIQELFETPEAIAMVTNLRPAKVKQDAPAAKVRVLDAAYWMKGCSSLGRLRFAVLLGVGPKKHQHFSLIDIKEAVKAAAPAAARIRRGQDYAERVVEGAKALSPYLGERMMAATLLGRPVVMRELMPQDLKLEMERLTCNEAVAAAEYLAGVVGKAHARQMDVATRKKWLATLQRGRSKSLDAPSWLWKAVVDLIASHESAYLEHCRRYVAGAV
jgi:uncharacterized protein (DUF2252 family)